MKTCQQPLPVVTCECGRKTRYRKLPVYCSCGRVYGRKPRQRRVLAGTIAWDKIHAYPVEVETWEPAAAERHYEEWVAIDVPRGCGCSHKWRSLTRRWAPDFSSRETFFAWTVDRHNDVNQSLDRPLCSLDDARIIHGWPQPPITSFVAVTSVSPQPKHLLNQPRCFDSWKRFGLRIVAVNRPSEIEQLRDVYPQVDEWVPAEDSVPEYWFQTQRINALCSAVNDSPFLLINSDIEIRGHQQRLLSILDSGAVGVGIRYNYTGHWRSGQREGWGIDAFLMTPEQAATLPQMKFCIGRPMWDYWLPYHFDTIGQSMEWIGEPYFYHEAHPVHWLQSDLSMGYSWMHESYGQEENWKEVRSRWPFMGK